MRKLRLIALALIVSFTLFNTSAFADSVKGQKIVAKKLKRACGFNGEVLAKKHTQDEWVTIYTNDKLNAELKKLCPKAKPLSEKYLEDVYDFLDKYASDSGNVPT